KSHLVHQAEDGRLLLNPIDHNVLKRIPDVVVIGFKGCLLIALCRVLDRFEAVRQDRLLLHLHRGSPPCFEPVSAGGRRDARGTRGAPPCAPGSGRPAARKAFGSRSRLRARRSDETSRKGPIPTGAALRSSPVPFRSPEP